jgi:hypothetical protein
MAKRWRSRNEPLAVKKQYGGSGESTNCHFNKADFVDAHVALVESAGQGDEKALVVEPDAAVLCDASDVEVNESQ